jgi:hypothetical protein
MVLYYVEDHGEGLYSKGFVPNLQAGMTELQHLQQATNTAHAGPYILTIPEVRGTPISENSSMLGLVNGSQSIVRKIWYSGDPNPHSPNPALPSVVFVEWDGYKGRSFQAEQIITFVLFIAGPPTPRWDGINPSWIPIVPIASHWDDKFGQSQSQTQLPVSSRDNLGDRADPSTGLGNPNWAAWEELGLNCSLCS